MSARFAQIVMGPAGSGKSTYIRRMMEHFEVQKRNVHAVNLDPAADGLNYEATIDIREALSVQEIMDRHGYGPNGGLIFCMEQIVNDFEWFDDVIGDHDYDYLLIDLPGQIELYSHLNILPRLFRHLQEMRYNLCGIFMIDSQWMCDPSKFISGCLATISAMMMIELPYVNILSKCDLLSEEQRETLDAFLEMDTTAIGDTAGNGKLERLTSKIIEVIDRYNMIDFFPLDPTDPQDVIALSAKIDDVLNYEELADYIEDDRREEEAAQIPDLE